MPRDTRRSNTCYGYLLNINFTILIWCATMVAMSTANYHISHLRPNVSNNIISLLCEDLTSNTYLANAVFWKDSVHRVNNLIYGVYTGPDTSATLTLTPQDEGNYTCNSGEESNEGSSSCNHLLLLAYPIEARGRQEYRYTVQVGHSVTMSCPFIRGALFQFYTFKWIVGYSNVREDDPRYVLNQTTFELTIINASFEDGDVEYMCQVKVHPPIGNNWIENSRQITLNVTNGTQEIKDPPNTKVEPASTGVKAMPVFTSTPMTIEKGSSPDDSTVVVTVIIAAVIVVVVVCFTCGFIGVVVIFKRNGNSVDIDSNKPNSSSGSIHELSIMESGPDLDIERRTHTATSFCSSSLYRKPLLATNDYPPCCDVQFVGSIEVVDCDRMGGVYSNAEHSIKVWVKRDAFPTPTSEDSTDDSGYNSIELEIGAAIHGRFTFPENMRPVSAILWLNVADKNDFEFTKDVEIELVHYLQLSKSEIEERLSNGHLGCLMAESNLDELEGPTPVNFTKGNPNQFIFMQRCGKIWTRRSCYMCLCATKSLIDSNSLYCLVSAVPRSIPHSSQRTILFFVCYNLSTFIQVIKNELKTCSTFTQNDFVFNSSTTSASEEDDKISINFGQKSASKGWLLTLPTDTTEVSAKSVELWEDDISYLRLRLQHKMYPPRVRVLATASEKAQNSQEEFTISGAQFLHSKKKLELTMQIPLLVH